MCVGGGGGGGCGMFLKLAAQRQEVKRQSGWMR